MSLSASSLYLPDFTSMKYLNYGAAVSEVSFSISMDCFSHFFAFKILLLSSILEKRSLNLIYHLDRQIILPYCSTLKYIYGALMSQVEINLLRGETTIVQSDIIYDSGQSLNPAVDLGQVSLTLIIFTKL